MIKFRISGAGGGKTTGLVEEIYYRYLQLAEYKKIYVITYTNYAVKQIIQNYINKYGYLPDNIKIMTVHKFCIKEIINPYYQYIVIPKNFKRIKDLEKIGIKRYI